MRAVLLFLALLACPGPVDTEPVDTEPVDTDTDTDTDTDADEDVCAALDLPAGRTVDVSDVESLVRAVDTAEEGDVIVLADGTYPLGGAYLWLDVPGLTLISASRDREAVVLDGGYATTSIASITASDVTIAHLTLTRAYNHPIHVMGGAEGDTLHPVIYGVAVVDPGQQGIKVNQAGGFYADGGLIACSHIELTDAGRSHIRDGCYTGGVDMHQTRGWTLRDNHVQGFWCEVGLSEHGIHLWRANAETLIERNTVVDCARGIGLGLTTTPSEVRDHGIDCGPDYVDDYRGTVRNNTVFAADPDLFASSSGFDTGIALNNACEATVVHNTVFSTAAPFNSMEWRFEPTSGLVANNLASHNLMERTPDTVVATGNIEGAEASWFADAAAGDLHLAGTSDAVDAGDVLESGLCDQDLDREPRVDGAPDVGADELP